MEVKKKHMSSCHLKDYVCQLGTMGKKINLHNFEIVKLYGAKENNSHNFEPLPTAQIILTFRNFNQSESEICCFDLMALTNTKLSFQILEPYYLFEDMRSFHEDEKAQWTERKILIDRAILGIKQVSEKKDIFNKKSFSANYLNFIANFASVNVCESPQIQKKEILEIISNCEAKQTNATINARNNNLYVKIFYNLYNK